MYPADGLQNSSSINGNVGFTPKRVAAHFSLHLPSQHVICFTLFKQASLLYWSVKTANLPKVALILRSPGSTSWY